MTIQSGKDRVVIAGRSAQGIVDRGGSGCVIPAAGQYPCARAAAAISRCAVSPANGPTAAGRSMVDGRSHASPISVVAPGASYITAAFEQQEVIVTGLIEADRGSQPRIAADDSDIDVAGSGCRICER
jgi:hypothetical protein